MENQEGEVDTLQRNSRCILQYNKCKEHPGLCPDPWIMIPQVHDFLHRLPGELQRMTIAETVVPQSHCVQDIFRRCYNPWECKAGAHVLNSPRPRITPSTCYTSKCQLVRDEGVKLFFQKHQFVFNHVDDHGTMQEIPQVHSPREYFHQLDFACKELRDPRATRLLDFVDCPEWKGQGSGAFKNNFDEGFYQHVNKSRYRIRHLVLHVDHTSLTCSSAFSDTPDYRPDWHWPLKIDWETLPDLKTLVLDLRGYSYRQRGRIPFPEELYDEEVKEGAKRMACLDLQSLVIYGLCSGAEYAGKERHKRKMEKLFQPAMAQGVKVELRDEEMLVEW